MHTVLCKFEYKLHIQTFSTYKSMHYCQFMSIRLFIKFSVYQVHAKVPLYVITCDNSCFVEILLANRGHITVQWMVESNVLDSSSNLCWSRHGQLLLHDYVICHLFVCSMHSSIFTSCLVNCYHNETFLYDPLLWCALNINCCVKNCHPLPI